MSTLLLKKEHSLSHQTNVSSTSVASRAFIDKHSLWVRIAHWINVLALAAMIYSGVLIYWANRAYWPSLPNSVYTILGLDHKLATGLSYHFSVMWLFVANGFLYVLYMIFSGEWREITPRPDSLRGAFEVVLHDLGLSKQPLPSAKFNHAQRIAYTSVVAMGLGSVVTGLAIYKPVQLSIVTSLLGGYETARLIHYLLTIGYVLFLGIHLAQVTRAGWNAFRAMVTGYELSSTQTAHPRHLRQRWIISFAVLFGGYALTAVVVAAVRNMPVDDGIPWPLRSVLNFNASLGLEFHDVDRRDVDLVPTPTRGKPARVNGDLGLSSPIDTKNWMIKITTPDPTQSDSVLQFDVSLDDLKHRLPLVTTAGHFRCIEGWSEVNSFTGVRFSEFLKAYHLGTHSGQEIDWHRRRSDVFKYASLSTPDGEYYVSIDMASLLNVDTLLTFEENGEPLTLKHGAPVRLYIPSKYGVKNIKRIGSIEFTDERPPDYWAELGYDWYLGL
jgi:thiosulfate reductase cytochrome b subunit